MRVFRITCAEESTVRYWVTANDEDEAREKLLAGDWDGDYDTIGSSIVDIFAVEDQGATDGSD